MLWQPTWEEWNETNEWNEMASKEWSEDELSWSREWIKNKNEWMKWNATIISKNVEVKVKVKVISIPILYVVLS